MISSKPLSLSTSSLDKVLKFLILSVKGSSLFFSKGTSNIVITLFTQLKFFNSFLRFVRFLIVSEFNKSYLVYK